MAKTVAYNGIVLQALHSPEAKCAFFKLPCRCTKHIVTTCKSGAPTALTTRRWNDPKGEYDEKYGVDAFVKLKSIDTFPPYIHIDDGHTDLFDTIEPSFSSIESFMFALASKRNQAVEAICSKFPDTKNNEIIVYIHGFNNNLEDAIKGGKCIQDATGIHVVSYDWASTNIKGTGNEPGEANWIKRKFPGAGAEITNFLTNYSKDSETAVASVRPFVWLLHVLFYKFNTVSLVCHSMGARVVTESIKDLSDDYCLFKSSASGDIYKNIFLKLKAVVFIQPDIDIFNMADFVYFSMDVVLRDIAIAEKKQLKDNITIYTQSNDAPLGWSRFLHGGTLRVGQITREVIDNLVKEDKLENKVGDDIKARIRDASCYVNIKYPKVVPEFISKRLPNNTPLRLKMALPLLPSGHGYFENPAFKEDLKRVLTTPKGNAVSLKKQTRPPP